ncbi:MAG: LPS export ABC transporter periplasmic protein LptC [Synechococcus sp.]|nr:LPS export ABC transporter periplasmic protein LptC [Synechococcus sp.]
MGAAALPLLLIGCRPEAPKEDPPQPFVFRSLNLRQKDSAGQPLWELTSPEARYDLGRKIAQARGLSGTIYVKGQPAYRLNATAGTVINDGEVVQLEGLTRLVRVGPKPLLITARRLRWYPRQERMVIDHSPQASQGDLNLSSKRALVLLQQEKLELRDHPLLVRSGGERLTLALKAVDWYARTGQLVGTGPVRGERRLPAQVVQTLTSPRLSGNSLARVIDLAAPVQLLDPSRKARLDARDTRIEMALERISSPHPFTAKLDQSSLSGQGFEVLGRSQTVVISRSCRIQQPGDYLEASRCSWNWQTNEVSADGDVVLRRDNLEQTTRAERLTGLLSKQGRAEFSNPGSVVRSQVKVPSRSASGPRRSTQPPPFVP